MSSMSSMSSMSIQFQFISKRIGLWNVLKGLQTFKIDLDLFVRQMTVLAKALGSSDRGTADVADYISRNLTNIILAVFCPYVHLPAATFDNLACNSKSTEKVDIRLGAHILDVYYAHLQIKGIKTLHPRLIKAGRPTPLVLACNPVVGVEKLADDEGSAKMIDCMALRPIENPNFNAEYHFNVPEALIIRRISRNVFEEIVLKIVGKYTHYSPSIAKIESRLLHLQNLRFKGGFPEMVAKEKSSLYRKLDRVSGRLACSVESRSEMIKATLCLEILEALEERKPKECLRRHIDTLAERIKSYEQATHQPPPSSLKPLKSSLRCMVDKTKTKKDKKKVTIAIPNPDPSVKELAIYETKDPSIFRRAARKVKSFGKRLGSSLRCIAERVNDAFRGIIGVGLKESSNDEPKPQRRGGSWREHF
ncbi:hypothetical protein JA9_002625 [Meyerozyma sp. JA9]|nr:hypothetical protein JA9_002625 [Meyerozyma sp. JA9]